MSMDHFEACLALTLSWEGGYADQPADPGGATNLGITRRTLAAWRGHAVTRADVRALTREEAAQIYRRHYWDTICGDRLPPGIDAVLFDHAVNSGPCAAIKALQHVLGLKPDGKMNPIMLVSLRMQKAETVITRLVERRRAFLARLRTFRTFGRGWSLRVAAIERAALLMVRQPAVKPAGQKSAGPQPSQAA